MRHLIIAILFLLPITVSAQLLRSYGVVEIGATFPTSTITGAKFAYRTVDSSYYRWVSGNTWVKIIEPSIIPDTLYLTESIGTSYKVSGDTINLTPYLLKSDTTAMLVKCIERGDTASMLSNYPTKAEVAANPTTIANTRIAVSNGSNLVGYPDFTRTSTGNLLLGTTTDVPTSILTARSTTKSSSPFPFHTTAESNAITGVAGNFEWLTDGLGPGYSWHNGTRKAYGLESTFNRGTSTYIPFFNSNGQITENSKLLYNGAQMVIRGTTNAFSTATKSLQVFSLDGVEMFYVNDNGAFGNAFFGVNYGGQVLTLGIGSGFPVLALNGAGGTYNAIQHQSAGVFNIGGGATSIIMGDASTWQNTRTFRINTRLLIGGSSTANRPIAASKVSVLFHNTDSTFLEFNPNNTGWVGVASRAYARSLVSGLSPDTWLGTRLNTGNVDINANAHELRIDSLTQFIVSAPSTSTLGGAAIEQIKWLNSARTKYYNRRLHYDSRPAISGGMPAFYNLLTYNKGSGENYEWVNEMIWDTTNNVFLHGYGSRYGLGYLKFTSIRSNSAGVYLTTPRFHFFGVNSSENETNDTYHTMWGRSNATTDMLMGLKDGGKFLIGADSTFIFDPNTDLLHITGTARITGSTGTPTSIVGRDGSGNISNFTVSSALKTTGGVLDLKRKSLIDSLPIASITIDAAAHNLSINNLTDLDFDTDGGNASIHLDDGNFNVQSNTEITLNTNQDAGLTLNSAANIYGANTEGVIGFKAGGEQWLWHYVNDDADPDTAMTLNTVGNLAYLKLQDYGNGNINSTLLSEYPGKHIPAFTSSGKVLEYRLARDTFIEDVALFSVGTMMYNCQELTIVSSMTSLAPSNMEIRFPDAGEDYRGKKIIVYSKKKDAGSFIPQIKVVGGVSRLYFTTNPAVGGTDPSDQSTLSIDDSTWSDHGTTFEFTCLKIDNTPSYRWVLKQR